MKIIPDPPITERRPVEIEQHGELRIDNYSWLRDDNWQEILRDPTLLRSDIRRHLEDENAYYHRATDDLEPLRNTLYEEMRSRVQEEESSVPALDGPYAYAVRYRKGGEYPIFVRTARNGGGETILFDGDREGEGENFFHVGSVDHSPDHSMIAYGVDRLGSEYFDIRIRRIETGDDYGETIASTSGYSVWAADSQSIFYTERDVKHRPKRIRRHVLGTDPAQDEIVYDEADDSMFLTVNKSQSGEYIFIYVGKGTTSECWYLRADSPPGTKPALVAPRLDGQLYTVEHHGKHFYIKTNAGDAVDFKIVRAPADNPGRNNWQDWLEYRPGVYINTFIPFADWIIRLERHNALPRIVVSDYNGKESYEIKFDEAAFDLRLSSGFEFDTDTFRYTYESPSTPEETYDFDMIGRERTLRKARKVPSGHDRDLYLVERLFVTAEDGPEIPVTVLRLKATPVDGSAPLFLYGYGSYGITIGAGFNSNILSLVDRGFIYAVAHIRGGSEKGRQWYLDATFGKKMNSFKDFARSAEALQERGYGCREKTIICGGSAGGLLVGATVNLRPDLFAGVIAAVPFVDVLTTISDASLPLTPMEWDEWGDPINDPQAYAAIAAYSPFNNIRSDIDYPPILATGGLTDFRVTYWEPAKWIARLREEARGGPFFLKMNMEAGHTGSAARFERLQERSHEYAFALMILGLNDVVPVGHDRTLRRGDVRTDPANGSRRVPPGTG